MKSEVYNIKVDMSEKLLAHILNAAGCIQKPRRSTETNNKQSLHELQQEIFEHLV
jgi:hypothetical protein